MATIEETWDDYYSEKTDTAIKDRNFFRLEIEEISSQLGTFLKNKKLTEAKVLELGCGTGFLIEYLQKELADYDLSFHGVDLSSNAIKQAEERSVPNSNFSKNDFLTYLDSVTEEFDVIITQRSIMALMEAEDQDKMLVSIKSRLKPNGIALLSEGFIENVEKIDKLRGKLDLEPIGTVWHSRYLTKKQVQDNLENAELIDFASTYWLVTRVITPHFTEPVHNSKIADFSSQLPQLGDYSIVKLIHYEKNG